MFLIVVLAILPSEHLCAKNYILNGDFENLGVPSEYANKEKWSSDFSYVIDTSTMYSGKQSLKVSNIYNGTVFSYPYDPPDLDKHKFYIYQRDKDGGGHENYNRMGVEFGGFLRLGSLPSATAELVLTLNIYEGAEYTLFESIQLTDTDFIELETDVWQHFSTKLWLDDTDDEKDYFYNFTMTSSGNNTNAFTLYIDDFYILPNLIDNGDFSHTSADHDFNLNTEIVQSAEIENDTLTIEVLREYNEKATFGKTIMTYKPGIINFPADILDPYADFNNVLDFSYRLKLADQNEEVGQSVVSATVWCKDLPGKKDRTTTITPFNNYITSWGTGREWDTYSALIHNPEEFNGTDERKINFCFNHGCVNSISGEEDEVEYYTYKIDDISIMEIVPHFPEIPTDSIFARIRPSVNIENPDYPGQLSTKFIDVDITWKTDVPSRGGYVLFYHGTEEESAHEDMGYIPKTVHRVRHRLENKENGIADYDFRIRSCGMERGYSQTDKIDLQNPPDFLVDGSQEFGFSSPVEPAQGKPVPVRFGVPLPMETLSDESNFWLRKKSTGNWEDAYCQTKILSHWFDHFKEPASNKHFARGIKWLLLSFLWEDGYDYRIRLKDEPRSWTKDDFIIQSGSEDYYTVSNMNSIIPLEFKVPDTNEGGEGYILYDLKYNDNDVLTNENIRAFVHIDGESSPSVGEVESVEVIYNGEICGIIEVTLSHPDVPGDEPLYTIVRITVYKKQPYILFDYSIHNDSKSRMLEKSGQGEFYFTITRMFLEVNVDTQNASSNLKYKFGDESEGFLSSVSSGNSIYLLQEGKESLHPVINPEGVTYDFFWSENGDEPVEDIADGWFGIYDTESTGLAHQVFAGIPNFSAQFPIELHLEKYSLNKTVLNLEFVPGDSSATSPTSPDITAKLPYSSRISYQNVFLFFADQQSTPEFSDDYMPFFNDPPLAIFPPSYYKDTGVFGPLVPESSFSDQDSPPDEEEVAELFAYYQNNFVKAESSTEGIFTIGYTDPDEHEYNKKGFGKEYWQEYRISDHRAHIVSNEYEIGSVFGRLGNILKDSDSQRDLYYRAARREGIYLLDRIFHWTPYQDVRQYNRDDWLPRGIPHHHWTGVHVRGYDAGHCQGIPILDWYYGNTGDRDALDMMTSFADAICISEAEKFKSKDQYQMGGLERHLGWPLYTLVQAYNATGDPYYILNAKTLVDRADSFLIACPNCVSGIKCYTRLIKTDGQGAPLPLGPDLDEDEEFKYAPVLGGETFTTAILNQAVAKYHETTGETAAAVQSETVGMFLKSLYVDSENRFYSDSYHTDQPDDSNVNLILVSPALQYIGSEKPNLSFDIFADQLIKDYNDDVTNDPPTGEMKQYGQITNFILDFMKYHEE